MIVEVFLRKTNREARRAAARREVFRAAAPLRVLAAFVFRRKTSTMFVAAVGRYNVGVPFSSTRYCLP